MEAIELKSLTKSFKDIRAVDGLSLCVSEGETFALLGQNGAGKTTTIRMLCGLLPPSEGDALVFGHSIRGDIASIKRMIAVSPQETAVAANLTVFENLVLMARLYGMNRDAAAERATELMASFHIDERARSRAKTLSGGLLRRLSIAMALVSKPRLLFLDEPTLGLDVRARRDLWKLFESLRGKTTVVLTTHYLEEAQAYCDRIAIMERGKLCALGTLEQLKERTGTDSLESAFLALTEEGEGE